MSKTFRFSTQVDAVLRDISTVREVREICREDGLFGNEITALLNYLRRELRRLAPQFSDWRAPVIEFCEHDGLQEADLDIAADSNWGEVPMMVSFGFSVRLDPTAPDPGEYPPDRDPYLYVRVPVEWRAHAQVVKRIKELKPEGFTDIYPPGDVDENTPIWKYLPLENYASDDGFNTDAFLADVVKGFADILPLRTIIDAEIHKCPLAPKQNASRAGASPR